MKSSGFYVDPRNFALSQIISEPNKKKTSKMLLLNVFFVAGPGIEPGTSWLWIMRSNQLSYPAIFIKKTARRGSHPTAKSFFVAGPGIEPGTSWLWIMRSNQLSYPAIISWLRVQR